MTTYAEPGHLPAPDGSEAADGPTQIGALAARVAEIVTAHTTTTRNALAGTDLWTGRTIWNTTTARIEVYNGSGWVGGGTMDHAALSNLTAGDPHTQYVTKATATAKGDLLVATASGVITRKAVGADGRALVADSGQSDGMAWADLSATYAPVAARTCKAYRGANQSIATATATAISFDTEEWDSHAIRDAGTPTRLVLNKVGYWVVTGGIAWDTHASATFRQAQLRLNGTTRLAEPVDLISSSFYNHVVAAIVRATAITDYVELVGYQTSGGNLNALLGAGNTFCSVAFLGT